MVESALKYDPSWENIPSHICGWLEVDLNTVAQNYTLLRDQLPHAQCAAVVKANAYGLGAQPISQRLYIEGCRHFFVAHLDEARALRPLVPDATIYVLTGCLAGTESDFYENNLTPVLNDYAMLDRWVDFGKSKSQVLPAILHMDTGMNRIGFDNHALKKLTESMGALAGINLQGIMSHLACSPDKTHPQNEQQRQLFEQVCKSFPDVPKSLADTAGIYLGESYHYDMVRPGKGLFGLYQAPGLQQAFTLKARIIQVRQASKGETVGYGAQKTLEKDSVLATLGIGYGDGLDRRSSGHSSVLLGQHKASIVGSLSMDYTVIDVTDIPAELYQVGSWAQLTGPDQPLEDLSRQLGTISRELSTRLGNRLYRSEK